MPPVISSSSSASKPADFVAQTYARLAVSLLVPVTVTVWSVVWAVLNLTPLYSGANSSPLFLVKNENDSQSSGAKFGDSLINALAVVAAITVMTFLIVLLYKCGCVKILIGWFVVSAALTFFFLTWIFLDLIFTRYQVSYDYITMALFLWNFGIVGLFSLFYHGNKVLTQVYLVVLSVIMSWVLTRLPEWSTWSILVLVAVYDILAVLCPGGPLKLLLQAAHDRNEPIPGFIYDSDHRADALLRDVDAGKKTTRNLNMKTSKKKDAKKESTATDTPLLLEGDRADDNASSTLDNKEQGKKDHEDGGADVVAVNDDTANATSSVSIQHDADDEVVPASPILEGGLVREGDGARVATPVGDAGGEEDAEQGSGVVLRGVVIPQYVSDDLSPREGTHRNEDDDEDGKEELTDILRVRLGNSGGEVGKNANIAKDTTTLKKDATSSRRAPSNGEDRITTDEDGDESEADPFSDAHEARPFKLGLGDFIFYSLLCGRAATASYVAWTSAYVAVTMGLLGTLTSLLFFRSKIPALPALPISIFLGVGINFLGRYVMSDYCLFMVEYGLGL